MSKRSISGMTVPGISIHRTSSDRVLGTVNGRSIRRAVERKRRIEAKKLAKSQSSKA